MMNAARVIAFAKANGFPGADVIYWDQGNPEYGMSDNTIPQAEIDARTRWAQEKENAFNTARWMFYAKSPQTALMLGSKLDPNDETIDWVSECNRLADIIMANDLAQTRRAGD